SDRRLAGRDARGAHERAQARRGHARRYPGGVRSRRCRGDRPGSRRGLRPDHDHRWVRSEELGTRTPRGGRGEGRVVVGARPGYACKAVGTAMIRIAIVEDHPVFRQGLVQIVEASPQLELTVAARSIEDWDEARPAAPAVVL